jgi:hypothetical protein
VSIELLGCDWEYDCRAIFWVEILQIAEALDGSPLELWPRAFNMKRLRGGSIMEIQIWNGRGNILATTGSE